MENIVENNKLIAEFMGVLSNTTYYYIPQFAEWQPIKYTNEFEEVEHFSLEEMKFHSSWNWLMPVVEKIEDIEDIDVNILTNGTKIYKWRTKEVIVDNSADISFDNKIEHTYIAVVEFIKWYNEQHKK